MTATKDYYAILGVSPTANQEDIRQAFLQQALANHPDRGGTHEKMVELSEAVEVLADPQKRALYDQARAAPDNAIALTRWQTAQADAAARAHAYPQSPADFGAWVDAISRDVQKTMMGRILTGLAGGSVFGLVAGFAVAYFMSINPFIGAAIGLAAGALGGAFAAASNDPNPGPRKSR